MRMLQAFVAMLVVGLLACKSRPNGEQTTKPPVQVTVTSGDATHLLTTSTTGWASGKDERWPVIEIDTAARFQQVDGFGFTLTGGSAQLIGQMAAAERAALLQELFGNGSNSIGISYLRISVGASDLDGEVFSYDDLPAGQTDPELRHFNLSKDTVYLLPLLKEILAIRPGLHLMASPWSPPVWMKTNRNSKDGNLKPEFYDAYARYFVKYVQALQNQGITLDAVTIQNEPQNGKNNPSLVMSAEQQADFVKKHLGPAFEAAQIGVKILVWDHNCDQPEFPLTILNDPAAKRFVAGSAFHLYGGEVEALSKVHDAHPDKALYFTEQWTGSGGWFEGDLKWHLKNVVIGSMRNWSRTALEWNLANDPQFGPHTPGGCDQCRGALTIDGSRVSRNVSYYIIAQASRFVPSGSVRIGSNLPDALPNVAFRRPDGRTALIVLNERADNQSFNIQYAGKWIAGVLPAGAVGTYVW